MVPGCKMSFTSSDGARTEPDAGSNAGVEIEGNPFKLPSDSTIFLLRAQDKEQRKKELKQLQKLKVYEKQTYTGRMNAKRVHLRHVMHAEEDECKPSEAEAKAEETKLRDSPIRRLAIIKDRNIEKESIGEFVSRKREMFLLEYSLAIKREEIEKLEKTVAAEEKTLLRAEKFLEEDAAMFDSFLKENDKACAEAVKIAEQETKIKLERISEIKRIAAKICAIKSDIYKYEEILIEYKAYKEFLMKLSPSEWQEKQRLQRGKVEQPQTAERNVKERSQLEKCTDSKASLAGRELPLLREARTPSQQTTKLANQKDHRKRSEETGSFMSKASGSDDNSSSDSEAEPELYFTEPQQLLDLLAELEEQNLSLIQNSRETEEALEEYRQMMEATHKRMEEETEQLRQQIDLMTHSIEKEQKWASEMEMKARLFSCGNLKAEKQDTLLESLGRKVEEVYHSCMGDSKATLSPMAMLTAIEGRLGELLDSVEVLPREHMVMAERAKEKARRIRLREEKLEQQKEHQEERMRKAMERSQAAVKRTTGKKLMYRSERPAPKTKQIPLDDTTDRTKEEEHYFFSTT